MALLAVLLLAAGGCGGSATPGEAAPTLTATPVARTETSAPPSPTPASPEPVTAAASPTSPSASPTDRTPSDADRARFVNAYQPEGAVDLDSVATDLDGDGVQELVFVYVSEGRVRVDVAWWRGDSYDVLVAAEGAAAERIGDLRVTDLNADGVAEVATFQSSASRSSATLWQATAARDLQPLVAEGGCWDGSFTYGIVGVELTDSDADGSLEIKATCDESPLPVSSWRTEVYEWRDNAYRPVPGQEGGTGTEGGGDGATGTDGDPGVGVGAPQPEGPDEAGVGAPQPEGPDEAGVGAP